MAKIYSPAPWCLPDLWDPFPRGDLKVALRGRDVLIPSISFHVLIFFPLPFSPFSSFFKKKPTKPKIFFQQHKIHLTSASQGMDFSEGGRCAFFMWL